MKRLYKAALIQNKGWHVVGNGEVIPVTAKTIALALAAQMNRDHKKEKM